MARARNIKMKFLPAHAKEIIESRNRGYVPATRIFVLFNWELGKSYTRIIITDKYPIKDLNFSFLAGLPVEIIYEEKEAYKVAELVHEILKVKPSWLATFGLHLIGGDEPAFAILRDEITKQVAA